MGQLEAAGIYRPASGDDAVRVAAPDADTFTLGAAAVELIPRPAGGHDVGWIALVGEFPPAAEWGFGVLLGGSPAVRHHAATLGGFTEALEGAAQATDPGMLISAHLPSRVGGPPDSAGAVALSFSGPRVGSITGFEAIEGDSHLTAAFRTARTAPSTILEDLLPIEAGPTPSERARWETFRASPTAVVSEGAYVPEARYRENLRSRWGLLAEDCTACGRTTFPAQAACRHCGRRDALTPHALPRDGAKVVARTTIGRGGQPTEFDAQVAALGPYDVVLVEWPNGARVTLPVSEASPGSLQIDDRIGTRLRRLYPMDGEWRYGRKAIPLPVRSA